jgi:hypothetical protein
MARRKTLPDLVKTKYSLAERLSRLRAELFGDRGGPELARRLGIPVRTWYNYEAGVTVPAEVVLKIIELTSVEPMWLLHGKGPKFRPKPIEDFELIPSSKRSVGSLLRTALQILEHGERSKKSPAGRGRSGDQGDELVFIEVTDELQEPLTPSSGSRYQAARAEWLEADRESRCVRVDDDTMSPTIAEGSEVVFADEEDDADGLDGHLVVAWVDGKPAVRRFQVCGRYAILRGEGPEGNSAQAVVDLESELEDLKVRRVVWISPPRS